MLQATTVRRQFETFPAVALLGTRQVGKTTLAQLAVCSGRKAKRSRRHPNGAYRKTGDRIDDTR